MDVFGISVSKIQYIINQYRVKFSEINKEELLELLVILNKIERRYRRLNVVGEFSEFGDQLFFSWRSRYKDVDKKSVEHFHLHIYPKFAKELNEIVGKNPWEIDLKL